MNLKDQLEARRADFIRRAPPSKVQAYQRATDELAASGTVEGAVAEGETAPDFTLPDAFGGPVTLSTCLGVGPVVLTFYRGGWCPYCNLQLRAYQGMLPELRAAGADLLAVTPEKPDGTQSTMETHGLAFSVLTDTHGAVAAAYRLSFEVPDEVREIYAAGGNNLAARNADGRWWLPIPATYLIDQGRRVVRAWVDAEYRVRAEPSEILAALAGLGNLDPPPTPRG